MFPPELVPHIRSTLPEHPALSGVGDDVLAELLTLIFFASLEREEGAHLPIRIVFSGTADSGPENVQRVPRWRDLAFTESRPCTAAVLRRLSRATLATWTFIHIGMADGALVMRGLARQGLATEGDTLLSIVSTDPGRLELWSGGRRELEYAHGQLMPAPENVILSGGPVQRALRAAAERAHASPHAWPYYLSAIGGIVRAMSAHGHGGILAILARPGDEVQGHGGFFMEPSSGLLEALQTLGDLEMPLSTRAAGRSLVAVRVTYGVELERSVTEIGGLTALDGATLLEPNLSVRAFGVILSTLERPSVFESSGAEPGRLVPFRLEQRGARHRAAAALAFDKPESIVFVASSDGDLGCMLKEPDSEHVLVWRQSHTPSGIAAATVSPHKSK